MQNLWGGDHISFIYFVLEAVQQYDLHVIWGPACIVWCWTSKGWANGKILIYGKVKHFTLLGALHPQHKEPI